MKAVILAAGRGTRISSVSKGVPKCLLRFGEETILDYQLSALLKAGVTDFALVVGHQMEMIVEHVAHRYSHLWDSFTFISNPRFATTNNIYSLWLAKPWVGGSGFICLNADVLLHPEIIMPAVKTRADVSMIIDPEWRDETMKVVIEDGHIIRMSKAITREEFSGTYLGVTTFSSSVSGFFFYKLETFINRGRVNEFFNVAVERMILNGIKVDFTTSLGLPWAEIDDPTDLGFALTNVYPAIPGPASHPLAA